MNNNSISMYRYETSFYIVFANNMCIMGPQGKFLTIGDGFVHRKHKVNFEEISYVFVFSIKYIK